MPDPTPTSAAAARKPTARQLAYLKDLAAQRGESFTYPTTAANASREINRMRGIRRTPPADITRDETERTEARPEACRVAALGHTEKR